METRGSARSAAPQQFDVLVLDAFSGDAIPVHLLTVEAFQIYLGHMAPQGVIAVHISNRHFDLAPVVKAIATHHHLFTATIHSDDTSQGGYSSLWMLVAADRKPLEAERIRKATSLDDDNRRVLWTDNQASLVDVLGRTRLSSLGANARAWISNLYDGILGAKKSEPRVDSSFQSLTWL